MAKLYLKFESNVLKEVAVGQKGTVTIGRLPDNMLQIDNLAVSGHHCKVYWESDHYVIEDNSSLNGTYLNNQRVTKQVLKDNDSILVGKHVVIFRDEWHEDAAAPKAKASMPAMISKGETSYFIAPQDRKTPVKVNGAEVAHRQELNEGDVIEVAGVKMSFAMQQ